MSRRKSIVKALAESFKIIDGSTGYNTNIFNNSFDKLKFWDEVNDFPCLYVVAGPETREYLPGGFKWCFLSVSIKVYTKGDDCLQKLEDLLEDVEKVLDTYNGVIIYDAIKGYTTTDINILSINTDEGLLAPYGVGEVVLQVQYQKM